MSASSINFEDHLKKLKNQYLIQLPEKINAIKDDWSILKKEWKHEYITQLHRNVHNLIGTSGTFGLSNLSTMAREIETLLKPFMHESIQQMNNVESKQNIEQKIIALTTIIEGIQTEANNESTSKPSLIADENYFQKNKTENNLIFYLDDDVLYAEKMTENLNAYGLSVINFRDADSMLEKTREQLPLLVILSLSISDYSDSLILNLSRQLADIRIKTFIISNKNDFDCRLAAVRAGASAFILKSIEAPVLVNMIKSELNLLSVRPPNVLFVDDQESILNYYSNILAAAGMKVDISNNPLDVLERMEKSRPDILVLDINMPIVKGNELAAVIRQFPEYQSIPILFLSAEEDNKTLLLEIGSDDLLQKGMPVAELVRQIRSRVERARLLSSFMFEDSLTGLLNHAQIQLAAEKNIALANRHRRHCSIVMIDLDNFKSINDTWGHQAGDKVIKAMSQLLKQRLRISDLMGRYGGEEFMLVLPDTDVNNAGNLINELRKSFEAIQFNEKEHKFKVTFSAGISQNSHDQSAKEMIRRADEALYRAKSNGKNKVCMSYNKVT